jgi:hypothetical protein
MTTNPPLGFADIPRRRLAALPFIKLNAAESAVIGILLADVFGRPNDGQSYTCAISRNELVLSLHGVYAKHAVYGAIEGLRAKGLLTADDVLTLSTDWPGLLPDKYREKLENLLRPRRN